MKVIRRFLLWLVFMLVIAFIVDAIGVYFVTKIGVEPLESSFLGYSRKAHDYIAPVPKEKNEKNRTNGLSGLALRALLDNNHFDTHDNAKNILLFCSLDIDESHIFFTEENGMNELSKGIFAEVYQDLGEGNDYIKNAVGLIDIEQFYKLSCASDVHKLLEKDENAIIKVKSYSIRDYIVSPAEFSVLDGSGNELQSFECPSSGELIKSDNTYVYGDVCNKLDTAELGERKADRIADELVSMVDFSANQDHTKRSYGLANITSKHVETIDGGAQVTVIRFSYIRSFILYTAVWGAVMTLIFLLVCRKKDKSFDFYY